MGIRIFLEFCNYLTEADISAIVSCISNGCKAEAHALYAE